MSHAHVLPARLEAAGATDAIAEFVATLGDDALGEEVLGEEVRHYARRHLLDTIGMMMGSGLIWDSPFGPPRVDYAIPISRRAMT